MGKQCMDTVHGYSKPASCPLELSHTLFEVPFAFNSLCFRWVSLITRLKRWDGLRNRLRNLCTADTQLLLSLSTLRDLWRVSGKVTRIWALLNMHVNFDPWDLEENAWMWANTIKAELAMSRLESIITPREQSWVLLWKKFLGHFYSTFQHFIQQLQPYIWRCLHPLDHSVFQVLLGSYGLY